MPKCGTQCWMCDLPVRFDTYSGCTHACQYCFAKRNRDIDKIERDETAEQLLAFIKGKRGADVEWLDWNIPLHIGGMSDPLQPAEKRYRETYKCLKVLAETQYPFVISTKGKLAVEEEYLDLLSRCNCVVQISMVCSRYDRLEQGAPTFEERLGMAAVLAKRVKRVVARVQPYMHEVFYDVAKNVPRFADAGIYGAVFEGMKFLHKKPGLIKIGGDNCYPVEVLRNDFTALRKECHRVGMKFYSGENRLRSMGDSLTCCGIDGLEGFVPNTYNLNHLVNGDRTEPTEGQKKNGGGASCFHALSQHAGEFAKHRDDSFVDGLSHVYYARRKVVEETLLPRK